MSLTVGVGFTVIVNVSGVPVHALAEGVTVMVAVTGVVPVFVAVNEFMFPFPLAANPMDGVLLVQPNEVPTTVSTKLIAVVDAPLHNICGGTGFKAGVGFTVMVDVSAAPVQLLADGVTMRVAVTGAVPVLIAVNGAMLPLPVAVSPIEVVLFVQSNDVPVTLPTKVIVLVDAPLHKVCGVVGFTVGVGFTVIVKLNGIPKQPLAEGVTVMLAVMGALAGLVAVKDGISPFPEAGKPIAGLSLFHEYVVFMMLPVIGVRAVAVPLHQSWLAMLFTLGAGFTVMVKLLGVPTQPLAVGVTVIVATTGVVPVLTAVNTGMSPLPVAAKPIAGLLFVQV